MIYIMNESDLNDATSFEEVNFFIKLILHLMDPLLDNKKNLYKLNLNVFKEIWEYFLKNF